MILRMENTISSWGVVLLDARILDQEMHKAFKYDQRVVFFSLYILIQLSTLMDLHMSMLVEAELLSFNEMDFFYWYWDYIISTKIYALNCLRDWYNHMEQEICIRRQEEALTIKTKIEASRKEEKKKKIKRSQETRAKDSENLKEAEKTLRDKFQPVLASTDELFMRMKGNLCRAIYKSYVALSFVGKIRSLEKSEYPFGPDWHGRFSQRFCAFSNIPNPFAPQKYEDFLTVVEKQFYQEGAPLSPLTIMDSVNDSHRNLRTLFEEIRRYVSLLSENDEISDEVYAVMGPQDILPVTNSTKLLKTNVICSLNSMKLQKLLKSIPEDTCKMSLTSDNTTCSDNYLKYFKFPVLALQG